MTLIPRTDLDVFGLNLGCNVFGWTADRDESFAVLDAYRAAGGNFLDTADLYTARAPGNQGGESETIIGEWLATRDNRDEIVIATKVGGFPGLAGLDPTTVRAATENSLKRLGIEAIDLLYAHFDDPDTPVAETLGALGELIEAGKVRYIAASNFTTERLAEALAAAEHEGLPRYVAFQPHYNLMERDFEHEQRQICEREGLAVFPYFSLAKGFLTGKYRPDGEQIDSPRAAGAAEYLDERGGRMLAALDQIAAAHRVEPAAVAVAWLRAQPTVTAPIASARNEGQLAPLLAAVELALEADELARLTAI
ncbi:MAG TPA: aldo/keto reductase [Solirubrobacterales bacterium]|jgi:aryl-alcohol dehydrogenase-like predicted oxidoreductase|nr:aldo/keto reductase [Solirubrobacterales bacterium]